MTDTDLSLLEDWRGGDARAGTRLFRRHFRAIRAFFQSKVDASDVDDLIQATTEALVRSRDAFEGRSSFRTYMYSVARSQLHRHLRRRVQAAFDPLQTSVVATGCSPSAALARSEEAQRVRAALQRVAVDHQIILELCYWQQLSGPELAEVLELPHGAVRTRLYRARQQLREALEGLSSSSVDDLERSLRDAAASMP